MNNLGKVRQTFSQRGFPSAVQIRKHELERFLNSLVTQDSFSAEVATEIWEQAAEGKPQVEVEMVCRTIIQAQDIVQDKLFQLNNDIKSIEGQLKELRSEDQRYRLLDQLQQKDEEKKSFEADLELLTEPFGISMIIFMANAAKSRAEKNIIQDFTVGTGIINEQLELRWLFYLAVIWAVMEIVVIYQKPDFLNLMVLTCLMLIFFMNQLDPLYMRFTLTLLIISQVMDCIWIFMNANIYWNPPEEGDISQKQQTYLKVIFIFTFIGLFLKIPVGVFLFHYRNPDPSKAYTLDLGCMRIQLQSGQQNPICAGLKNIQLNVLTA